MICVNINSLEIELRCSVKSPLAPLYQRGVIPPFAKGRSGGIYGECPDNYETINRRLFPSVDWKRHCLFAIAYVGTTMFLGSERFCNGQMTTD